MLTLARGATRAEMGVYFAAAKFSPCHANNFEVGERGWPRASPLNSGWAFISQTPDTIIDVKHHVEVCVHTS